MRARGMTYDTGFVRCGRMSREHFDPAVVRRELANIRDDVYCNAVQIIGGDPDRLEVAAELGLEVWFSVRLTGSYERDEAGQAAYLDELLEIFETESVGSAFVCLFALPDYPHRPGGAPRDDLDRASLSIVEVLEGRRGQTYPDRAWEPKAAFAAVASGTGG
ncbi:hypothetical protein ABT324_25615 [Saccharopolyspora sp. NPDC000359]|uniref:hypothetical protein n=1 Tax=Saccharopolyspora sp. NPDC000359 TaxID=3154251 RepID=UPI003323576D